MIFNYQIKDGIIVDRFIYTNKDTKMATSYLVISVKEDNQKESRISVKLESDSKLKRGDKFEGVVNVKSSEWQGKNVLHYSLK